MLAVNFVSGRNLDGVKVVEDVGFHHYQFADSVHHNGVFEGYHIKPSASARTSGCCTKFVTYASEPVAIVVEQFGWERSASYPGAICLEDTVNLSDPVWSHAESCTYSGSHCV